MIDSQIKRIRRKILTFWSANYYPAENTSIKKYQT